MLLYFAYPSYSDYFMGRGDDKIIITDREMAKSVTVLGDNKIQVVH